MSSVPLAEPIVVNPAAGSKRQRGLARLARLARSRVSLIRRLSNTQSLTAIQNAKDALRAASLRPLSNTDAAMAMQLWNKVLAFQTAFAEAAALQWRLECCYGLEGAAATAKYSRRTAKLMADDVKLDAGTHAARATHVNESDTGKYGGILDAISTVETNGDPLARALGARLSDLPDIVLGFLDAAIRSASPHSQTVQREAYRSLADQHTLTRARDGELSLECETVEDYCNLLSACGVPPHAAVALVRATLWAINTHTPYAQTEDLDDLARGFESAIGMVVTQYGALPLLTALQLRVMRATDPVYCTHLPSVWRSFSEEERNKFGEDFYRRLLVCHPDLLDYFPRCDMDALAYHLARSLDFIFRSSLDPMARGSFRPTLERLADVHRRMSVPTHSYPLMGATLVKSFQPYFERAAASTPDMPDAVTLRNALLSQYRDVMSIMHFPMRRQERLLDSARDFLAQVAGELSWSEIELQNRLLSVETEVLATGTYTHTADELRLGARIAWRNSSKCIGRISWNTLEVRDCRHIDDADGIFEEVCNHLRIATAGTNIQSVMTVFRPQAESEALGTRFWSSQLHRFAAYKDTESGEITGDSANLELTNYLLNNNLWTPPEPRTAFDILPLVLKHSGRIHPHIYQLPSELIFEVDIEHPTNENISNIGYKWCTVPAICNFKMTLGGITYQNMPFNGWFMSTEIVRNLVERFDAGPAVATACRIDTKKDPFWRQQASLELERAVIHSFNKNGFTIVDPMSAGQSFCTHVERERQLFGRECPAQWSWIGGLVGPTNRTWHLEMRDFAAKPQYDYCVDGLKLHKAHQGLQPSEVSASPDGISEVEQPTAVPRVLIVYGSETGNAESAARTLKRELRILKPTLCSLDEAVGLSIVAAKKMTHVLCICSTFGNGEPPSNSRLFFNKDIVPLSGVKFAVLGLGSTIYPNFCKAGVTLDNKLDVAGLERLCKLTKVDEAAGSEGAIIEWHKLMKSLVISSRVEKQLAERLNRSRDEKSINRIKWIAGNSGGNSEPEPESGSLCLSNVELLPELGSSQGAVRKITFEAPSDYVTGDHISVQPVNSNFDVTRFLTCFEGELAREHYEIGEVSSTTKNTVNLAMRLSFEIECVEDGATAPADLFFPTPITLGKLLRHHVDLGFTSNSALEFLTMVKGLLQEFLRECGQRTQSLLAKSDAQVAELASWCTKVVEAPSATKAIVVDEFLSSFPTIPLFLEHYSAILFGSIVGDNGALICDGPLLKLVDTLCTLRRLQPRYYSISSSNTTSPDTISATVKIVRWKTSKGAEINGACSNYLASLVAGKSLARIAVKTSTFRLPDDPNEPMIMVGAGTGLSPLIGFLEDLATSRKSSPNSKNEDKDVVQLFFGCRTEKHFIYESVIEKHESTGLVNLHVALSQTSDGKKQYVQDRIVEEAEMMSTLLLRDDVHYFVCGDARMAEACFEACVDVLRSKACMSRVSAVRYLRRLRVEQRWNTDVWGIVSNHDEAKKAIQNSRRAAAETWMATFQKI